KRREVSLYPPNKRWWFEEGSQFRAALDAALKSVSLDWPIRAFLWSGANSVHARDRAASELSEELRKDLQDPNATAVIIAHSHGGNVALRALQDLESMAGRIRVITLATPFLRVFARRSWQVPYGVEVLMGRAIGLSALARNHLDCVGDSGSTRQLLVFWVDVRDCCSVGRSGSFRSGSFLHCGMVESSLHQPARSARYRRKGALRH